MLKICEENLQGILSSYVEKLTKNYPGGYHIVIKSDPRATGDRTLVSIRYKYRSQMFIGIISVEGYVITEPGFPCLYIYPENYYIVYILPVVHYHVIIRYVSDCIEIDNRNMMWQYYISIYKYWVTQSGYFIILTIVPLGMGITYGKLLLCYVIS